MDSRLSDPVPARPRPLAELRPSAPRQKPGRAPRPLKGQSSVETLMILGISIAFIIPLALIFMSSSSLRLETLSQMEAKAMAQQISDAAGEVWYQGPGARKVILINYPDKLRHIELTGSNILGWDTQSLKHAGRGIVLSMDDAAGHPVVVTVNSPAPVRNLISDGSQSLNLIPLGTGQYLPSGLALVVVKNEGTYVNVVRYVNGVDY